MNLNYETKQKGRINTVASLNNKKVEQKSELKKNEKKNSPIINSGSEKTVTKPTSQPKIIPIPKIIKITSNKCKNLLLQKVFKNPEQIIFDGKKFVLSFQKDTEIPCSILAEYILREYALNQNRNIPRSERNIYYHRHIPNVDTGYRLFGKQNYYSYSPILEDFIFLVESAKQTAQHNPEQKITLDFIKSLLTQSLSDYNFKEKEEPESLNILDCKTLDKFLDVFRKPILNTATENLDHAAITHLVYSLSDPAYSEDNDNKAKIKIPQSSVNNQLAFKQILETNYYDKHLNETLICNNPAYGISELPSSALLLYKKNYRNWLTDEMFLYIIHLFETLTNTKEPVSLQSAIEEAQFSLGDICPSNKLIQTIYQHWRIRRNDTRKPLLRQYWTIPSSNDTSPFAVFRARTREKIVLRRQRKVAVDARYNELMKILTCTEKLLLANRLRDWLKLALCDIDCLIYEQLWKELEDPTYEHPVLSCLEKKVIPKIEELIDFHLAEAADKPQSNPELVQFKPYNRPMEVNDVSKKRRRSSLHIPIRSNPVPNSQFYMGLPKCNKATDTDCSIEEPLFISPQPLPPVFLELNPRKVSLEKLKASLQEAHVSSFSPMAFYYSDSSSTKSTFNLTQRNTSKNASSKIEPFVNVKNIPTGYLPVYIQDINCLPKNIQHICNCRFVIPFGKSDSENENSDHNDATIEPNDNFTNSRYYFRYGRSHRLWLHKFRFRYPSTDIYSQFEEKFKEKGVAGLLVKSEDPNMVPVLINIKNILLPVVTSTAPKGSFSGSGYYYENNPIECSLSENPAASDIEPGFMLPFGFDTYENTGGAASFCLPRYSAKRSLELENWISEMEKQKPP